MNTRSLFRYGVLLTMYASTLVPQSLGGTATVLNNPRQVVEEFWNLETAGGLLTEDGWKSACKYYVQPAGSRGHSWSIIVVADWSVWPPFMSGNTAKVNVDVEIIGTVDPQMNFSPHRSVAAKEGVLYTAALTRESCSLGQNGKQMSSIAAAPDWRLDHPLGRADMYLSLDSALRYVAEVRDRLPEGAVKANASATLRLLQRRKKTSSPRTPR